MSGRPYLTKHMSRGEKRELREELDRRVHKRRQSLSRWIAVKKQENIEAGLYRKTIGTKTYIYKPLGEHLWERTSEDGKNRTLVKYLPDDLD